MKQYNLLNAASRAAMGSHLRTVREFHGLTRLDAAMAAGLSVSWIKKLETGRGAAPEREKLQQYCKALTLDVKLYYTIEL